MRTTTRLLVVLACCLPGAGLLAQSKIEKDYAEFVRKFKEAKELNDNKRVLRALKDYPDAAILQFEIHLDKYVHANDNAAYNYCEDLRELWPKAWGGSQLLDKIERWRSNLDPSEVDMIAKLTGQESIAWRQYTEAKEDKKERGFERALDGMQLIAERYQELGAKLKEAKAWNLVCSMVHGWPGTKNEGHTKRLMAAMERYLELNQDLDWTKHADYALNKNWYDGIQRQIEHEAKKGKKDGSVDLKKPGEVSTLLPYQPGSKWVPAKLEHRVMKKPLEGLTRYASSSPIWWLPHGITPEKKEFWFFKDGKIWMQKLGPAKYVNLIDPDEEPTKKDEVTFAAPRKPTELWYTKSGREEAINYWYFMWLGGSQEPWCGTQLNLEPSWNNDRKDSVVFLRSASYFEANVAGNVITLYDENINGVFGDKLQGDGAGFQDWMVANDEGTTKPGSHPAFDSMRIGKGKLAPFSPFVKLGDKWYHLKVLRNNEQLNARPLDVAQVKTGTVSLKWKGKARPKSLIIKEVSGQWAQAAFDLVAAGARGVVVPVGRYEVYYGRIHNGKPPRNMDAVILKGHSKAFDVKADQKVTLKMGAPLRLEYLADRSGDTITVSSSTMWVKEAFGAKITCIASEVLEPEILVAKKEGGKGAKTVGQWRRLQGFELNAVSRNYKDVQGRAAAAYAIDKKNAKNGRYEISAKVPNGQFVGLRQKKHKLFGKLLPVWK